MTAHGKALKFHSDVFFVSAFGKRDSEDHPDRIIPCKPVDPSDPGNHASAALRRAVLASSTVRRGARTAAARSHTHKSPPMGSDESKLPDDEFAVAPVVPAVLTSGSVDPDTPKPKCQGRSKGTAKRAQASASRACDNAGAGTTPAAAWQPPALARRLSSAVETTPSYMTGTLTRDVVPGSVSALTAAAGATPLVTPYVDDGQGGSASGSSNSVLSPGRQGGGAGHFASSNCVTAKRRRTSPDYWEEFLAAPTGVGCGVTPPAGGADDLLRFWPTEGTLVRRPS